MLSRWKLNAKIKASMNKVRESLKALLDWFKGECWVNLFINAASSIMSYAVMQIIWNVGLVYGEHFKACVHLL